MKEETTDYIKRLIEGVREQAKKDFTAIEGDKCIPPKWLDAVLLCDVIEKELL